MSPSNMLRAIKTLRGGLAVCDFGQVALCGVMAVYAGSHGEIGWSAALVVTSAVGAVLATIAERRRRPPPVNNDITIVVTRETTADALAADLFAAFKGSDRRGSA